MQRVIGWKLDRGERKALLRRFPPRYPDVDADHVTLRGWCEPEEPLPPEVRAEIVGRADDGGGLEALAVAVDGATARPDGSVFHITWSLDGSAGRRAPESNALLVERGWTPVEPIPLRLIPAEWPY